MTDRTVVVQSARSVITTVDEAEAWAEVRAILGRGDKATVSVAAAGTCAAHYHPRQRRELCQCEHAISTYLSRTGDRCWCCFGKVPIAEK